MIILQYLQEDGWRPGGLSALARPTRLPLRAQTIATSLPQMRLRKEVGVKYIHMLTTHFSGQFRPMERTFGADK